MRRTITYTCERCDKTVTKEIRGGNHLRGRFCSRFCFYESIKVESCAAHSGYRKATIAGEGQGYVHRQVMAVKLGRALKKGETVHHINGDRSDNRPENLEIWHKAQVPGQRLHEKLKFAVDFALEYGAHMPLSSGIGDGFLYL